MTDLHPRTLASIHLQGVDDGGNIRCGCCHRGDRWWLCAYHDGYEDALDAVAEVLPEEES